jgi:hypothetical protein
MEVVVRCYAGFKGEERPVSFDLEGRTLEVLEVELQWYEEHRACFRVRADNEKAYVLCRNLADGHWELEVEG